MDEKSDIDIGLNKIVVPKNEQGSYGSKDYLNSLNLSEALVVLKFYVASHLLVVMMARLIVEMKPKIAKKSFLEILQQ